MGGRVMSPKAAVSAPVSASVSAEESAAWGSSIAR